MNTQIQPQALDLLCTFVDKRPGLNVADYGGDFRLYRRESAEITRDRSDFYELLRLAHSLLSHAELEAKVTEYLTTTNGRLTFENGKLKYVTGQYFPTEYRPASSRVLVSIIWREFMKDQTLQTGHDIRRAVRSRLKSRRVARLYFS
jgi:hypothetical protein